MTQHCTPEPFREATPGPTAIDCARKGNMMLLADSAGAALPCLMIPAQFAYAHAINRMATHARGLICLALDSQIVDNLNLALQPQTNRRCFATPFTVSIEAGRAVSTGISAADRATTIAAAIHPDARPGDLATPGHIFPIRVERDSSSARTVVPRVAVEICRSAGLRPAAVICDILDPAGAAPGTQWLVGLAAKLRLQVFLCNSIAPTAG